MFNDSAANVRRVLTTAAGALVLSTACLAAAVSPVRAAEYGVTNWKAEVERSIDRELKAPAHLNNGGTATVRVTLASGQVVDAALIKSSGDKAVDAEALRTARAVAYPDLPAALRTGRRTVDVALYVGPDDSRFSAVKRAARLKAEALDARS